MSRNRNHRKVFLILLAIALSFSSCAAVNSAQNVDQASYDEMFPPGSAQFKIVYVAGLPVSEINTALVDAAVLDAKRKNFDIEFMKAVRSTAMSGVFYVFFIKGKSDSYQVYRTDEQQTRLEISFQFNST